MVGLFSLFTYSCVKESGNEYKPNLPVPEVSGFEKSYTAFTHRDILSITPQVKDEAQFDFYWTVFSNNYTVGTGIVPKGDTITRTKNLNYEVLLNPGSYTLVFNIRNKQTRVTQMVTSDLSISTLTMTGWYLLKDDGQKTDFDFFYTGGKIENWMANFNNGKSLSGKAVKSIFAGSFKIGIKSTDLFSVLVVLSDQDAAIYRVDNGKQVMNFDNMFFTKPDVRRPQNVLQPMADNFIQLINDGKIYVMSKGTFFANPPVSSYKIGPTGAVGSMNIIFDENSKSLIYLDGGNFVTLPSVGNSLKNMDATAIWMAGYPALRGAALTLFRQSSGDGLLVKLNTVYGALTGSTFPGTPVLIADSKAVPKTHGLMSAPAIGGNYDSDYIYYANGNKVYMTDLASLQENLQVTLPENETVTCIQHIKFPQPVSGAVVKTDYLAIASYANGHYKVWLQTLSSTGGIQAIGQPKFEGQGKISCVNYMELGNGSRVF